MSGSDSPTFFHGQPWSSWIEKIGRDKPLSDEEPDSEPASSVMRLSVDDIDLYGFCPERDTFYGVVCEICNSIVKPQALIQHMESRHPSGTTNLPPPTNAATKPSMKTPYCKLSKLKKSQSSGPLSVNSNNATNNNNISNNGNNSNSKTSNNHTPVKQRAGDAQSNLHTGRTSPRSPHESTTSSLPCVQSSSASSGSQQTNNSNNGNSNNSNANNSSNNNGSSSPVKSPGNQPKRKRLKAERSLLKDREYDPDRHCGVWNEETGKPCTRSLTCKAHTVSLRRTVTGRSKTFDKLLAEHRAAKEPPKNSSTTVKVTASTTTTTATAVTGTVSIVTSAGSELNTANALAPTNAPLPATTAVTPTTITDIEAPSSPPVLSLPDTYPLPQAVDLLYRCLAPHGSNKPTKLEEDFANELESNRGVDTPVVNNNGSNSNNITNIATTNNTANTSNNSMNPAMTPISVVLPSLSPIQTGSLSPAQSSLLQYSRNVNSSSPMSVDQMIGKQSPASVPIVPSALPINNQAVLEAKTAPIDMENSQNITVYTSPAYKDGKSQQVTVQISRASTISQSPSSRTFVSLFDSSALESADTGRSHAMTNGKRLNNHLAQRTKHEFQQDFPIQLEASAAPTAFTNFNDINWSSCHPEPLAVTRWLRINSSRKQYNFNIH